MTYRRSDMTTTNTISAEGRRKVAEACTGQKWKILAGRVYRTINVPESLIIEWDTVANLTDILALINKAAQLIHEMHPMDSELIWSASLVEAIATNDVTAIEELVLQLLEGKE